MSDIKYGLISKVDAECIEATLNYIMSDFPNEVINVTEVGCYAGESGNAFSQYIKSKNRTPYITGIDNNKDGEQLRFDYDKLIIGNSSEVYNQLEDDSQHFLFIDGGHDFPTVISDYFCFRNKVKRGGFLCFHDSSPQAQGKGWQGKGSETDNDMFISVRKALNEIGLLSDGFTLSSYRENETISRFTWKLKFDKFDPENEMSGVCIFEKLY